MQDPGVRNSDVLDFHLLYHPVVEVLVSDLFPRFRLLCGCRTISSGPSPLLSYQALILIPLPSGGFVIWGNHAAKESSPAARVGGGETYQDRHRQQGQMQAQEVPAGKRPFST